MSIRDEQCRKVCRILDDVLANRPTERDTLCVAVDKAFEALIQPEQRWIPVTERLPEERYYNDSDYVDPSDSVLVFTRYKTYYISRYWGHRTTKGESNYVIPDWMDLDEYISDAVIAWTPLPEEYRG